MTNQQRALTCGLSAVLLWSTVATAFKLSLQHLSPIELLLYAGSFATLLLGIILSYQGKLGLIFKCSHQEYTLSIVLGFLSPFLYYLILFKAYELLPAQQAQALNYTWAITLSLLAAPLLKQKINRQQWLALTISYIGVLIISTEGHLLNLKFTSPLGVTLALISTIIWSLYWIYNTRDKRDPLIALFLNFSASAPFVIGYYLLTTELRLPPMTGILGALYIGVVEMGVCFILWLMAMKLTDSTAKISNLIFLSPFLSLFLIHFLVGENIIPATLIGLIFIIAGLLCHKAK